MAVRWWARLLPRGVAGFVLAALVLRSVACLPGGFIFDMPRGGSIRNVLLISIDTCRADHLSCYGYQGQATPNIDAPGSRRRAFYVGHHPVIR